MKARRRLWRRSASSANRPSRPPALRAVRSRGGGFRRRLGLAGHAGEFAGHPGASSENARYERGDEKVDVEARPMQVEADAIDLDIGEVGFARALKVLNEAGRKLVGAAVRQLDEDPAGIPVVAGRGCARFASEHSSTASFRRFEFRGHAPALIRSVDHEAKSTRNGL